MQNKKKFKLFVKPIKKLLIICGCLMCFNTNNAQGVKIIDLKEYMMRLKLILNNCPKVW